MANSLSDSSLRAFQTIKANFDIFSFDDDDQTIGNLATWQLSDTSYCASLHLNQGTVMLKTGVASEPIAALDVHFTNNQLNFQFSLETTTYKVQLSYDTDNLNLCEYLQGIADDGTTKYELAAVNTDYYDMYKTQIAKPTETDFFDKVESKPYPENWQPQFFPDSDPAWSLSRFQVGIYMMSVQRIQPPADSDSDIAQAIVKLFLTDKNDPMQYSQSLVLTDRQNITYYYFQNDSVWRLHDKGQGSEYLGLWFNPLEEVPCYFDIRTSPTTDTMQGIVIARTRTSNESSSPPKTGYLWKGSRFTPT